MDKPSDILNDDVSLVAKADFDQTTQPWVLPIVALIIFVVVSAAAILGLTLKGPVKKTSAVNIPVSPTPTVLTLKARATYTEGGVWKIVADRKIEIKETDVLNEGDIISTDSISKLVLAVDDGSVVRVGENSQITLSELKPSLIRISEKSGILFARVNKSENQQFLISANKVIVTSLGTAFAVENQKVVQVKVFESTVKVSEDGRADINVSDNQQWQEGDKMAKNLSQSEINQNKFLNWSLTEDAKNQIAIVPTIIPTAIPTVIPIVRPTDKPIPTTIPPTSAPTAIPVTTLSLTGETSDSGIKLTWNISGPDATLGFQVVMSNLANPTFPESTNNYVADPAGRNYTWDIKDGKTWHFRICKFLGDKCGTYSNDVAVTAPVAPVTIISQVKGIRMSAQKGDAKALIDWSADGKAALGFKILWATTSGPTSPTRAGDSFYYDASPVARHYEVNNLQAGKPYYFRVCEYLGDRCGTYSNEIMIQY